MHRISGILIVVLAIACIGVNIADASGFVPCDDSEHGAASVSLAAPADGHVPAPVRPDGRAPRGHCSVVPPFSAAIPCARIAVAQPQPDRSGFAPLANERWSGRTPPPLLGPPRPIS